MFWRHNNTSSPHFEKVLQKEGVTLQELMEEDDIIQECKLQNKKLVEFLCRRNVLEELVTLITKEPSEELDERLRFKYPNIACELLTCDVPQLNESLSRDNELLDKLYSFIDKDPPLNPLLASFLSRTLGVLIVKRIDQQWISYQFTCLQAMGFLKDKENFINLLLKHLGTSAIMDLTLKLITEVGDDEHRQNLLNWLDSQNLVQSLIGLMSPSVDGDRQHNASQLMCDVLRISRDLLNDHRDRLYTDPILVRLESSEMVSLLLDNMFGVEKTEGSIVGGIQVLLALLGQNNSYNDNNLLYNKTFDEVEAERQQKVTQTTAKVILNRLKDFHQILLDPPKKTIVKTSIEILDPPLGNTRLQVIKLLAVLIGLNNPDIMHEIMRLGTIEVLLDLFFKYVWNNFLHSQVQACIAAALVVTVPPSPIDAQGDVNDDTKITSDNLIYPYLFNKCRLLDRIIEAWKDNDEQQVKPKGLRQGYMGHLINIANDIVRQFEVNLSLKQYVDSNVESETLNIWNHLVENQLTEVNKMQRIVLGGVYPNSAANDDSAEEYNIAYPLQQQIQQLPSHTYQDDEFNDTDDPNNPKVLEKFFRELYNPGTNADTPPIGKDIDPVFWDTREGNNSSDEEDNANTDPWSKLENTGDGNNLIMGEPSNPWSTLNTNTSSTPVEDGWADFGSFTTDFSTEQQQQQQQQQQKKGQEKQEDYDQENDLFEFRNRNPQMNTPLDDNSGDTVEQDTINTINTTATADSTTPATTSINCTETIGSVDENEQQQQQYQQESVIKELKSMNSSLNIISNPDELMDTPLEIVEKSITQPSPPTSSPTSSLTTITSISTATSPDPTEAGDTKTTAADDCTGNNLVTNTTPVENILTMDSGNGDGGSNVGGIAIVNNNSNSCSSNDESV